MKEDSRFLFRAWDYESGFVYGYYTKLFQGIRKYDAIVSEEDGSLVRYYIHDIKTLGQNTGLKDKNGVEIYEGDIVKITTESNSWISKVGNHGVWHEIIVNDLDLDIDFMSINYAYDVLDCEIEVIGNIYENPELLEDKQ